MILAFVTSFSRSVCLMMKIRKAAAAIEQVERRRALSIIHVSNPPAGLFLRSVVNEMREAHARSLALLEKCTHQKFQQPAMWDYLTSIPRTTVAVRLIIHLHATHSIHNTELSAHTINVWLENRAKAMQHFSALVAGASERSRVINSARRRKSAKFKN
jgi:hypothetical protein